jgi:hypothetical protein
MADTPVQLQHSFTIGAKPAAPAPEVEPQSEMMIEAGQDPTVLVVAFTGFAGRLVMPTFDFLSSTGLLRYSRILLRDASRTCYFGGLPPITDSMEALMSIIGDNITRLAPRKVLVLGNSGGSLMAMLTGHTLRADYVHVFSAYTNLDPVHCLKVMDEEERIAYADTMDMLSRTPEPLRRYLDLANVLKDWNGKTRYNVHVCDKATSQVRRAQHIAGLPGVTVHRYPCDNPRVVRWLAKRSRLLPLLRMENQEDVAAVAGANSI